MCSRATIFVRKTRLQGIGLTVGRLTLDQFVEVQILHPLPFSRRVSLVVRTPPSQGGITGSSPVRATNIRANRVKQKGRSLLLHVSLCEAKGTELFASYSDN